MDFYENEIKPDDWIVSDVYADRDDDPAAYERKLRKKYDTVKRDVNAIDGLSVKAPDWATLIATKKREKSRAIQFALDLKRSALVLTLKSARDIRSPRVEKREQTSANRWHVEVRLTAPAQVDRQLTAWLRAAYELAGP